jgi:hypothetical protein
MPRPSCEAYLIIHSVQIQCLWSYVIWHQQCTALRFLKITIYLNLLHAFSIDNKKASDTMKFLRVITHDSLKKVKKRAICFKHDSNKPQIPDYGKGLPTMFIIAQLAHLRLCWYCSQNSLIRYLRSHPSQLHYSHPSQLHYSVTRLALHNFRIQSE